MADTWRVLEDPADPASAGGTPSASPGASDVAARPMWPFLVVGLAVVAAVAVWLLASGPSGTAVTVNAAQDALPLVSRTGSGGAPARPTASAERLPELVIEVNGAVRRPGIYRLVSGSRIGDAIAAAGGYGGRVDAVAAQVLNLAAKVDDGQQIHVPLRGERAAAAAALGNAAPVGSGPAAAADPAGPINVNTATSAQLEALPGIGPATAAKIIAARATAPFASVDDLHARKVVGAATLEKIRTLVVTN